MDLRPTCPRCGRALGNLRSQFKQCQRHPDAKLQEDEAFVAIGIAYKECCKAVLLAEFASGELYQSNQRAIHPVQSPQQVWAALAAPPVT